VPEAKPADEVPEAKPADEAPEAKPADEAPEAKAADEAPEAKAADEAPEAKAADEAPEAAIAPSPAPEPPPPAQAPREGAPTPEANAAFETPPPEQAPREGAPVPVATPAVSVDFDHDPQHKNAARIARVMVSDLLLYHTKEVTEGIKAGDFEERMKDALADMQNTFKERVPLEVCAQKNHLQEALAKMIAKKRTELGLE
jgi:hypothetical protein